MKYLLDCKHCGKKTTYATFDAYQKARQNSFPYCPACGKVVPGVPGLPVAKKPVTK